MADDIAGLKSQLETATRALAVTLLPKPVENKVLLRTVRRFLRETTWGG